MTVRTPFIAAAILLAGGTAFAQLPLPPPGAPRPPGAAAAAPEAGTVVTGRVQRFLLNPSGEADGLLLADGTQVAFPPHLSADAMQLLQPGDTVQVGGWRAPGVPVLRMRSLEANGRSLVDTPPAPGMAPPRPPREPGALDALSAQGRIERLLYTDRGDVRGVLLADQTIVRFPPHVGAMYRDQLKPGAELHARGWGTRGAQGTALEATGLGPTADTVAEVVAGPGALPELRDAPRPPGERQQRVPNLPRPMVRPAS